MHYYGMEPEPWWERILDKFNNPFLLAYRIIKYTMLLGLTVGFLTSAQCQMVYNGYCMDTGACEPNIDRVEMLYGRMSIDEYYERQEMKEKQ